MPFSDEPPAKLPPALTREPAYNGHVLEQLLGARTVASVPAITLSHDQWRDITEALRALSEMEPLYEEGRLSMALITSNLLSESVYRAAMLVRRLGLERPEELEKSGEEVAA